MPQNSNEGGVRDQKSLCRILWLLCSCKRNIFWPQGASWTRQLQEDLVAELERLRATIGSPTCSAHDPQALKFVTTKKYVVGEKHQSVMTCSQQNVIRSHVSPWLHPDRVQHRQSTRFKACNSDKLQGPHGERYVKQTDLLKNPPSSSIHMARTAG
jgi:hypothetical protein